jgi:glycopeptide antibiotics resistance protein
MPYGMLGIHHHQDTFFNKHRGYSTKRTENFDYSSTFYSTTTHFIIIFTIMLEVDLVWQQNKTYCNKVLCMESLSYCYVLY